MDFLISIKNLSVSVEKNQVIKNLSLDIQSGCVHALMGANGSGKSSLASVLMGHPSYIVESGSIYFNGKDITCQSPDKRARSGLFLAAQNPCVLPGVSVVNLLTEAYRAIHGNELSTQELHKKIIKSLEQVGLDASYAQRMVHEGFSGGEKKRLEISQLLVLQPQLAILDEIDSGLDILGRAHIAQLLNQLKKENSRLTLLVITHYPELLDQLKPDYIHHMEQGEIMFPHNVSGSRGSCEFGV